MKILVVGGAGYVGGALTDLLLPLGHDIVVYDNLTYEDSYLKPVKFVQGDIRDQDKLKPLLGEAEAVVWLAALVGDGACALNPGLSKEINTDSVKWLAENYNGRIVFMSTCSVYGAQDGLLTETSPVKPLSVYAATKLEAEDYLINKNSAIFRLGTLYGKGDDYSRIRLDLVLNTMTVRATTEGVLKVFGGQQYRPLLHVRDAARTVALAAEQSFSGIYNLSFMNLSMMDLAQRVQRRVPCQIETVETSFEDARNYKADASKAINTFNFKPMYTIGKGIAEIFEVIPRIKDVNSPRYSNQKALELFK